MSSRESTEAAYRAASRSARATTSSVSIPPQIARFLLGAIATAVLAVLVRYPYPAFVWHLEAAGMVVLVLALGCVGPRRPTPQA